MKRMVYYYANPFSKKPRSGSEIRPLKMLQAFKDLGYEVDIVSGYSDERLKNIEIIKNNILKGIRYEFAYCENTSMPTTLSDKDHFPRSPFLDLSFFKFLKKNNIPAGLFYRDIYWKFDAYRKEVGFLKSTIARIFYHYEMFFLSQFLNKLFLPSIEMFKYISYFNVNDAMPLPPGSDPHSTNRTKNFDDVNKLKLIYVGGMSYSYKLDYLFEVVSKLSNVQLTICTREAEWLAERHNYENFLSDNILVVHKSGIELEELYLKNDIAILFLEPDEYRTFAAPIKLYEYISWQIPIIASANTLAGTVVSDFDIGWTIPYDKAQFEQLLITILNGKEDLNIKIFNSRNASVSHTWLNRAQMVEKALTGGYSS